MSTTVITKKEIHVPVEVLLEVADVLLENEIINDIIGTDADEDTIILEVQYEKQQREAIHEVDDIISDFQEQEDQEDNKDNEKDTE